jgi:hypothetical protein
LAQGSAGVGLAVAQLAFAAARVIKASEELSDSQKLVWLEIYRLDQRSDRCFASAAHLGQILGKPLNTIERVRRELKDDGLLGTAGSGRHGACWWPELPTRFIPAKREPSVADVVGMAKELDGWLRVGRHDRAAVNGKGVASDAIHGADPPQGKAPPVTPFDRKKGVASDAISAGAASPASVAQGEGVGGGDTPSSQRCETTLHPPLRTPEVEVKAEEGARARAKDEAGGRDPPGPGWRDTMRQAEATARAKRSKS